MSLFPEEKLQGVVKGSPIPQIDKEHREISWNHALEEYSEVSAAEVKEKIFTRQYFQNTGLGLGLSREILGITDITIRETGEPGKNARFEITVPIRAWRIAGKNE
jgi:hypothetical protein